MATPRAHIEDIRRTKFSIGGLLNPLTEDLHQAVRNLSAELYTKDVHFLMELIQNAEDNEYTDGVKPSLQFIITSVDVTLTGAASTLVVFNNERGFSPKNIDSICSVGRSTKKNNRKRGYIGEKGIGFKSVFLVTSQPYIFSNGYQIRFNEEPCPQCGVGYVVPEWVEENPILSNIKNIYGRPDSLPATVIVLPLKPDKIEPVKQQLSSIRPELLLFLSKIKQLSVREVNNDPQTSTISAIAISSETNFVTRKNIDAESYTLHLSSDENGFDSDCPYYMWKQKFPVREENKVERRFGVEELVITLAFPYGERLSRCRGLRLPGVYAFLPTEMVTNFPFIIQADFVLSSSRETILLDNKWNQGILDYVPSAFVNAFISLVKTSEEVPLSSLPRMFSFLPIIPSSFEKLNVIRNFIKEKLLQENIIPSHSFLKQKFFHKPREVGRLMPAFWDILMKASDQGVSLLNLSTHGRCVLSSSFDQKEYDEILNFLEVKPVNDEWYVKCIQGTNIVEGVSDDVYLNLLLFIAENWSSRFHATNMRIIPLVKYVNVDKNISTCSLNESTKIGGRKVCLARNDHLTWLDRSNIEFSFVAVCYFMPESTQKLIRLCSRKEMLLQWLREQANVDAISVVQFAKLVISSLPNSRKHIVSYIHFLHCSKLYNYLTDAEVVSLCRDLPLVDKYGTITRNRQALQLLIPADGSNWAQLLVSNPWQDNGCVELGQEYIRPANFAGEKITQWDVLNFVKTYVGASDIPILSPPNSELAVVYSALTVQNVVLLLDWIRSLKTRGNCFPDKFLKSIQKGCWLRITINGSSGYRPPSQSFDLSSSWASILQNGSVLVDIPVIDHGFYGYRLKQYAAELKTIGVMSEYDEVLKFIGNHLMSMANFSNLTRENVYSILNFIRFLSKQNSIEEFIHSIRGGTWLKTHRGYSSPVGSVLYDKEWKIASLISNIPFIDQEYYGDEILSFKKELKLLGVVVGIGQISQIVVDNLKPMSQLNFLGADSFLLILSCISISKSAKSLVNTFKNVKCINTSKGYKLPGECFLSDPSWGCILQVFNCFPIVDCDFYGSKILYYKEELKNMGVMVDFEGAVKVFSQVFRQQATAHSLTKETVISFLSSYKKVKSTQKFPSDLKNCIKELKWLRTRLGDKRSPKDCILYGPCWEGISSITLLPFIDDSRNHYGNDIHQYINELKNMGVVTEFKDGAEMVAAGLCFPQDPVNITSASVLSLLECIRILMGKKYTFHEVFSQKITQRWLKTCIGYKSPKESLLFIPEWGSYLKPTDGPFIDEKFYEFDIKSYSKELKEIGVSIDSVQACKLLSTFLGSNTEFSRIERIYTYLNTFNWKPEPHSESTRMIWIPDGDSKGQWVNPEDCVLSDEDDLFGLQLRVLERYYKQNLLIFFSKAFNVRSKPSVDDYCQLWKNWESNGAQLSQDECFKFWKYVTKHANSNSDMALSDAITMLPAISDSDIVILFDKRDVFIADDLLLKELFEGTSPHPIFVWHPQPSSTSLPRMKLFEVYKRIGVRNISESVKREDTACVVDGISLKHVNPIDVLIGRGLLRLILGFLADPAKKIEETKRHEAVQHLLNLSVLETSEPIEISYSLSLTSGEILNVGVSRFIRWERDNSKFFIQKMDTSRGHKELIAYATYFSEVISEGILWENNDYICSLSELIRLAFMLNFDEEAVEFIMKFKNLELFEEDEKFLSSAFPEESK